VAVRAGIARWRSNDQVTLPSFLSLAGLFAGNPLAEVINFEAAFIGTVACVLNELKSAQVCLPTILSIQNLNLETLYTDCLAWPW
jgi:hypothetical protein